MSERDWLPGLTISQDPNAVEDYEMDFTNWLDGETNELAEALPTNCTASIVGNINANVVRFRVSAVAEGAFVTVRVTSSTGRKNDFTTYFRPIEQ